MSDCETFDTDLFIEEIHNLPCLWDHRTEEYSNRILKNKAWEIICKKFYEDFDTKETKEKNKCAANLQRKWRSEGTKKRRDSFNRDLKKQNTQKSGSGAGSSRRYYYFNQLSFLKPLSEKRTTKSSLSVQNKDDDMEQIDTEGENTTSTSDFETWKKPKNNPKKDDAEYGLIKKLTSHLNDHVTTRKQEPAKSCDSDMHFLLSLYDRFKSIRDDWKMNAQIEILNVIQKYHTPTNTRNDNYNHGQGYTTPAYGYKQYERPSSSRSQFMQDMETGSPQLSSLRTETTRRDMSVPESPFSDSSQASIIEDIFAD